MLRTSLQQMAYRGRPRRLSESDVKYTFFTRWYRWTKPFWKKISLSNWIMKPAGRWVLKTKICETTINLRVLHIKSGPNATWRPPRHAFLSRNQRFAHPIHGIGACFSICLRCLGEKKVPQMAKWWWTIVSSHGLKQAPLFKDEFFLLPKVGYVSSLEGYMTSRPLQRPKTLPQRNTWG